MNRHFKDGNVLLYQLKSSEIWQARLKSPDTGRWRQVSTRTANFEAAGKVACEYYDEMKFRLKHGLAPVTRTIGQVAEHYLKQKLLEVGKSKNKRLALRKINIVKRHILPLAISKVLLSSLQLKHIRAWYDEIATLKGGELKKTGLSDINAVMNELLQISIEHNWLKEYQKPKLTNEGIASEEFPWFDSDILGKVLWGLRDWVYQTNKPRSREVRELLIPWCRLLIETGMRPGTEINNLRWKDIDPEYEVGGKQYVKIWIGTSKTRPHYAVAEAAWWEEWIEPLLEGRLRHGRSWKAKPDDFVFANSEGVVPTVFGKSFAAYLKSIECTHNDRGEKYVAYSLRHTYITKQLLKGTPPQFIAEQCGTSIELVSSTYNHMQVIMAPEKLVRGHDPNWLYELSNL